MELLLNIIIHTTGILFIKKNKKNTNTLNRLYISQYSHVSGPLMSNIEIATLKSHKYILFCMFSFCTVFRGLYKNAHCKKKLSKLMS